MNIKLDFGIDFYGHGQRLIQQSPNVVQLQKMLIRRSDISLRLWNLTGRQNSRISFMSEQNRPRIWSLTLQGIRDIPGNLQGRPWSHLTP